MHKQCRILSAYIPLATSLKMTRFENMVQQHAHEVSTFSQVIIATLSEVTAHKQYISERLLQVRQQAATAQQQLSSLH